jgi:hypothetical protein
MSKWTRTRRDPGRTYTDETTERTERMIAKVRKFLKEGVHEDEAEFVVAVKAANPKIARSELKEVIKQFHDAVLGAATARSSIRRRAALNFFSDSLRSLGVIPRAPSSMMPLMVSRSVSVADLRFAEVAIPGPFLRFVSGIQFTLSR